MKGLLAVVVTSAWVGALMGGRSHAACSEVKKSCGKRRALRRVGGFFQKEKATFGSCKGL